ncbi:MAG: hypothetical protein LAO04_03055 [Acidobacteriia bacterium]|nr:hypothetical protein [Terriglobia bacterium]
MSAWRCWADEKPGRYIFQHRGEGEDHYVHFTQVTKPARYSGVTPEGGGVPKVYPGEVKCRLEPLPQKVAVTTLYHVTEEVWTA